VHHRNAECEVRAWRLPRLLPVAHRRAVRAGRAETILPVVSAEWGGSDVNKPADRSPAQDSARSGTVLEAVRDKLGLLNRTIKLERSDGKVRVTLDSTQASANKTPVGVSADAPVQAMRQELKELLNRCPGSREVLPHLAGLEHAIKTQGLAAFETLPQRVLQRASGQLESVVTEPVSAGIAELRSRIGVALKKFEKIEQAVTARAAPSSFLVDEKLQVSEGSHTDFMAAVEEAKRRG
jgi:hypothetical protein